MRDGRIQTASTLKGILLASALDAGTVRIGTTIGELLRTWCGTSEARHYARGLSGATATRRNLHDAVVRSHNAIAPCQLDAVSLAQRQRLFEAGLLTSPEAPSVDGMGILGVAPMDLLSGHAAIFNNGVRRQPRFSAEDTRSKGVLLYGPRAAQLAASVLRDVVREGTAARAGLWLHTNDVAGKTGTAQGGRKMLFVGRKHRIVSLLRVGVVGGAGPAHLVLPAM